MTVSSNSSSKHVMLSYQWNDQKLVSEIYQYLKKNNLSVWMDIQGGMKANIYECMAEGVENASVIVCFMTPTYQASENCQQELQFAKTQRVPIVACRLTHNWKPTGWLGLITAGLLMVDLKDITNSNFERKVNKLLEHIHLTLDMKTKSQLVSSSSHTNTEFDQDHSTSKYVSKTSRGIIKVTHS
ncbi:unnamed protein product [Rotaria sordida]|uniref:TIR domain-containing protein n=1 Tax=Rotaria sordida TaxID=392033 RepID=A0A814RWS3_9BILA|nr:unnamed protein product [Rotaria sordida]CAF1369102.1 unnamed protein product [Rotaria sordida]